MYLPLLPAVDAGSTKSTFFLKKYKGLSFCHQLLSNTVVLNPLNAEHIV